MLSAIGKNIITARLYDRGIRINPSQLDNYIIDPSNFADYNLMYDFIVNNYGKLIIE